MGVLGPDPLQPDLIERLVERYEVLNQIPDGAGGLTGWGWGAIAAGLGLVWEVAA
jgi:hypothetical protein